MTSLPKPDAPNLLATVNAIAHSLADILPPGEVAALRRLRPHDPSCDAFWRLAAVHLTAALPNAGPPRDIMETRWAVIVQAMAEMRGLHTPRAALGAALARAGIAEQRALRLLRASGESLFDAVRVTAHYLATTATSTDQGEVAALILSDDRDDGERVRRRIARDYYTQLDRSQKETTR